MLSKLYKEVHGAIRADLKRLSGISPKATSICIKFYYLFEIGRASIKTNKNVCFILLRYFDACRECNQIKSLISTQLTGNIMEARIASTKSREFSCQNGHKWRVLF